MIADTARFGEALAFGIEESGAGIGTLSERYTHRVFKLYFDPDVSHHERELLGYVADIFNSDGVTEIQTRSLGRLCPKLRAFLPVFPVTVVIPVPIRRTLCWIDTETGEITKPRTVSRKGRPSDALFELSSISEFLCDAHLTVILALINADDRKLKNGTGKDKKRGAERQERIPTELLELITLKSRWDYLRLIPDSLDDSFTAAQWSRATALKGRRAYYSLKLLYDLGVVSRTLQGKKYIYEKAFKNSDSTDH